MLDSLAQGGWLPVAFMALMGCSVLAYVILDGFDLGVGLLSPLATEEERDRMVASIGPFWDANETWLVLGVGILLVAFPRAHGLVLGAVYLPVAMMLVGLILRGVAFDFRAKADARQKPLWDRAFIAGAYLAAVSQGYMLGRYVLGFRAGAEAQAFALLVAACLVAAYAFIGAAWLVIKTEHALQRRAVDWARRCLGLTALGAVAISSATPLVSPYVFERWFSLPAMLWLLPVPVATAVLILVSRRALVRLPSRDDRGAWLPFACGAGIFTLCFAGLAYSFWPYVVPDRLTMWEAASAPESLLIIFMGSAAVLPVIVGYTVYVYRVFGGKARALSYD